VGISPIAPVPSAMPLFGAGSTSGVYKITRLLPPEGDDFQYKIKSTAEPHERVVRESQLARVDMSEF
jgi:hypothetical protein